MGIRILDAGFERTLSLAEGLESGWYVDHGVLARYQFAADLDSFLTTPGVVGTLLADRMRVQLDLPDERLHALPNVGDLVRRVRDFLTQRTEQVLGRHTFELPLVPYEMWLPPVGGATATVTTSVGEATTSRVSFKILGLGGGPTFEQTATLEITRKEVTRSERLELVLTATAEQVQVSRSGQVEATYLRLADLSDVPKHRFVALAPDQAPPPGGAEETIFRVALAAGDGPASIALKLSSNRSLPVTASLRLPALETEIGISYVRAATTAFTFEFYLPDGFEYAAAERLDRPAITWVTSPASAK